MLSPQKAKIEKLRIYSKVGRAITFLGVIEKRSMLISQYCKINKSKIILTTINTK